MSNEKSLEIFGLKTGQSVLAEEWTMVFIRSNPFLLVANIAASRP
ncbi:hypothetical protein ACFLSG_02345 [Candidatus Bipolaricaulota bacterium]